MKIKIKDPGSALTHFIAMLLALFAAAPLLGKAARGSDSVHLMALTVFIVSMILLYAASTIYHTLDISASVNRRLRKLDHMMIFILIAGTYTPVCLIVLGNRMGYALLGLVWGIAWWASSSTPSGSAAPNGFRPSSTSPWAGRACWLFPRSCRRSRRRLRLAPGRRHYLHHRRSHLRAEAADF